MSGRPKTYVIARIDQFLYMGGLGTSGFFYLVFDMKFFLAFKFFFLAAVAFTVVRDWKYSWVTFTTIEDSPTAVPTEECEVGILEER